MPYFHKWKLQPAKIPTPQEQWECTKQVLFSHFTIQLPTVSLHDMLIQSFSGCLFHEDLAVPPSRRIFWHGNLAGSFPLMEGYSSTDFILLLL